MAEAIVILAGGAARRFPGKLEHVVDSEPMIVRVFENLRYSGRPVYIAGKGSFAPQIDAALAAPMLIDRWPPNGPLHALLSACPQVDAERIFAVAADQPRLERSVLERLAAAWQPGDEAVVPQHGRGIEPLAALYDRRALLREGFEVRRTGHNAMRDLIARLATRFVPIDEKFFHNVNRAADLAEIARTA